ncbi:M48 family metallopeptidase [Rhodococcus spelaei]|uniref:M48 family metallopeptidase n=1 Tax=Rhodococcus spelaei TaxID=2546320 RepID=UPI003F49AD6F
MEQFSPVTAHPVPPVTSPGFPPPQAFPPRGLSPWGMPARHRFEIALLVVSVTVTALAYLTAIALLLLGRLDYWVVLLLLAPAVVFLARGQMYASQRVNGVKMTPTQFPDGYRMLVEAAARFGMREVPDGYVVLGNGRINAFASGHGFRRYVVVYSDLFEIGGHARNPDALAFIVGHEVGHIAAGHASYWRQLGMFASNYVPGLGSSLSRAQEYTADNHGLCNRPDGAVGAIGVLGAGKYLMNLVGFHEMADRAVTERGFFPWLVNLLAGHPVLTWRAHALRDRSRHGRLFFRP